MLSLPVSLDEVNISVLWKENTIAFAFVFINISLPLGFSIGVSMGISYH